jgi:hypothetical protein
VLRNVCCGCMFSLTPCWRCPALQQSVALPSLSLHHAVPCCAVLQVLDMSGNPFGGLPPFFSRMQALRKLLLASTHMLLLPAAVSSLTGLEHLNLSSNKLQVGVPAGWCTAAPARVGAFSRLCWVVQVTRAAVGSCCGYGRLHSP